MEATIAPQVLSVVDAAHLAITLTRIAYNQHASKDCSPSEYVTLARSCLSPDEPAMLLFALHSLAVYLDLGYTTQKWLAKVEENVGFGSSFRRCFFFAYKGNRSPYPRVTNRGVQTSIEGQQLALAGSLADE